MNNDKLDKSLKRVATIAAAVWLVCFLLGLSLLGAIVYVAAHFIRQIW